MIEEHFICHFIFEERRYSAEVSLINMEPWPEFHVLQTDFELIEKYGKTQVFTYEYGVFTWLAVHAPFYDGYLKTAVAESLYKCIEKSIALKKNT